MQAQPHLDFNGRCEEAAEFYRKALGAEVTFLMRYKESPDGHEWQRVAPASAGDKVLHMSLRIGDTTVLASDGRCLGRPVFRGFALSLAVSNADEATRVFRTLAEGGQVQMALTKTFFSPQFGMLADRFGVSWMIYVAA